MILDVFAGLGLRTTEYYSVQDGAELNTTDLAGIARIGYYYEITEDIDFNLEAVS